MTNYNDKYRIVLTCWDYDEPKPYNDFVNELYDHRYAAYESLVKCATQETESLNEPTIPPSETEGHFKVDFDGDDAAIVRLWEHIEDVEGDNDYMNVTAYNIHKLEDISGGNYKYRGFYVLKTKRGYEAEQFDVTLFKHKKLEEVLNFIDQFNLAFNGR